MVGEETAELDFSLLELGVDILKQGGQAEFWKRYNKLNDSELAKIKHYSKNMENAFQHARGAAWATFFLGEENARKEGYNKEIRSELTEKKQGVTTAFLDTNRDLWNNEAGISYALRGKKEGKGLDEITDEIFKNIISDNSDFIIDYKNDKRRWDKNATEENLWKIIKERKNERKNELFDMAKKSIKNILPKNSTPTDKKEKANSSNWSIENHKAFLEGFDSGILGSGEKQKNNNKKDDSSNNSKKAHWTDKFNIGNPETDKGHWVTLDNGKHIFIKD